MLDTPQCVQWMRSSMCSVRAYFSVSLKITILYVFNPHYGCHEHIVCQDIAYPNRGDICLRCTKIALAHESFCYFLIFCFFVVRRGKRLKFSIVIHWFLRVKENFWLDVID